MTRDPRLLLAGLPRTVRRHRALLAAGLAAAAVATALPTLAPAPAATVTVLAAARELRPGSPLSAGDLRQVGLPRGTVPAGALTDETAVVGRLLTGPVRRGEPLTDVRLVGAGLVPRDAGLVAAPVRLADPAAVALLHAGDRVDVLATPTGAPVAEATTVATGVQVLAVPPAGDAADGALVVVAALPAVAARLAAAAVSSRLSITVLAS